jgi:hypothetical protein
MSAIKNTKGANTLVDFITKISVSIKDWNGRFLAKNWSENDKVIYSKNLRHLIALRDRKLNQSSISAIQKISIINTYYFDFSQSKKINMIMEFVYNKMTSIGYQKIRDISTIMSMLNDYLLALKNICDSIADVNATYKTMNEIKQYIDANMNSIATEFKDSERVEGNYLGRNEWLPGRICKYNVNGSYIIRYDSGDIEYQVNRNNIRSISKHRANQTKKQCQAITENYNRFNTNYYARVYMQKDFQKTNLNDDVVINIMSYF